MIKDAKYDQVMVACNPLSGVSYFGVQHLITKLTSADVWTKLSSLKQVMERSLWAQASGKAVFRFVSYQVSKALSYVVP